MVAVKERKRNSEVKERTNRKEKKIAIVDGTAPAKEKVNKKIIENKRPVIHDTVNQHSGIGDNALTRNDAWELLGCTEDGDAAKKAGVTEPLFYLDKCAIYCINNIRNRELRINDVETLVQEILNLRWRYNGEPVIIGKTGLILNGQHTLVAIILAEAERTHEETAKKWADNWPEEIKVEKDVTFGIEETDDVVNTMDTCRSRSLTDVMWRTDLFRSMDTVSARKAAVKAFANCIKHVSFRTGRDDEKINAYSPHRTHAESVDFFNRHPRIEKAVKHIIEESKGKAIAGIPPGWSSALLYLMGGADTDGDKYREGDPPREGGSKGIDFKYWDRAREFWTTLLKKNPGDLGCVYRAIALLKEPSMNEKVAIVIKAWNIWKDKHKVTIEKISLGEESYEQTQNGQSLIDFPELGGIDHGAGRDKSAVGGEDEGDERDGPKEGEEPSDEEKKEFEINKMVEDARKKATMAPDKDELVEKLIKARKMVQGRVVLFEVRPGTFLLYGEDAEIAAEVLDIKEVKTFSDGQAKVILLAENEKELDALALKFGKAGKATSTAKEVKIDVKGTKQIKVYSLGEKLAKEKAKSKDEKKVKVKK